MPLFLKKFFQTLGKFSGSKNNSRTHVTLVIRQEKTSLYYHKWFINFPEVNPNKWLSGTVLAIPKECLSLFREEGYTIIRHSLQKDAKGGYLSLSCKLVIHSKGPQTLRKDIDTLKSLGWSEDI
jgi:hypothetical protein